MLPRHARTLAAAICIALAAGPLAAQDDDDARRAAATAYVELPAVRGMLSTMLNPDALVEQFRATVPSADQLSEEQFRTLARISAEEIDEIRPMMIETMRDKAAATFTLEELEALTAFYGSPEGAAILGKTESFMREYMQTLAPTLQATMRTISERIQQEITP